MGSQEQNLSAVGATSDERYTAITDTLARIEEAVTGETPPNPEPGPEPTSACKSGVYTGANSNSGQAEKDFGNWRGKTVEKVMTFTPDDKWDTAWWISVFGGNFPFKDRLIITRGLCLKGQNVETPLPSGESPFTKWGRDVHNAGITKPVFRLGHEANGTWYPWKIQGHEQKWADRFELAASQIKAACPDAIINFCLAADQRTDGFRMPDAEFVDEYAVDLYDLPGHIEDWNTHVAIAQEYGVPFAIPEWGLWDTAGGGRGDNPSYIEKMDELTTRDCGDGGWECYFNKDSSGLHKLDHYPNGKEEYQEDFGGFVSSRAQFFRLPRWQRDAG